MTISWTRVTPPSERRALRRYVTTLRWKGVDEREIIRAYLYADCFGVDQVTRGIVFQLPDCGDWDCLNPTHQIVHNE